MDIRPRPPGKRERDEGEGSVRHCEPESAQAQAARLIARLAIKRFLSLQERNHDSETAGRNHE
jgi:hypothetical protein